MMLGSAVLPIRLAIARFLYIYIYSLISYEDEFQNTILMNVVI